MLWIPSHLCVYSFASGCMALPVLMNIKQVIEQRQCSGVWTHKDELPVRRFVFTSLFHHCRFNPAGDSHQSCLCRLKLTWGRSAGITPCSPAPSSGSRRQRATHQWSSSAATSSPETPSTNWLMLGSECAIHPKSFIHRLLSNKHRWYKCSSHNNCVSNF